MHELEKVRKQLEVEKLELQSALEEAEVRASLCLHPCLGPIHGPPNPTVLNSPSLPYWQVILTPKQRAISSLFLVQGCLPTSHDFLQSQSLHKGIVTL